jgi:hypothetical protein
VSSPFGTAFFFDVVLVSEGTKGLEKQYRDAKARNLLCIMYCTVCSLCSSLVLFLCSLSSVSWKFFGLQFAALCLLLLKC